MGMYLVRNYLPFLLHSTKQLTLASHSPATALRPNGVKFLAPAGTTEFVRRWNPKIGDIVSFKYRGFLLGSKKPILPTLYRLRTDLTWDDVVNNWKDKAPAVTGNTFIVCVCVVCVNINIYLFQYQLFRSNGRRNRSRVKGTGQM